MKENFDLLGARLNDTNNKETSPNATQKALDDNCIAFSNTEQEISGISAIITGRLPEIEKVEMSGKKTTLRPRLAPVSGDQDSKTPPSHFISQFLVDKTPREGTFARFAAGIKQDTKKKTTFGTAGDLGFSFLETNSKENGIPIEVRQDKKNSNADALLGKRATRRQTKAKKTEE